MTTAYWEHQSVPVLARRLPLAIPYPLPEFSPSGCEGKAVGFLKHEGVQPLPAERAPLKRVLGPWI